MEIRKMTTTTSLMSSPAKSDSTGVWRSELTDLDFDDQVDKVTGAIELFDSNLMDGTNLKEEDFADNLEERLQVSRS